MIRPYRRIRRRLLVWWIDWQIDELESWEELLVEDGIAHPGVFTIELASLRSRRARLLTT